MQAKCVCKFLKKLLTNTSNVVKIELVSGQTHAPKTSGDIHTFSVCTRILSTLVNIWKNTKCVASKYLHQLSNAITKFARKIAARNTSRKYGHEDQFFLIYSFFFTAKLPIPPGPNPHPFGHKARNSFDPSAGQAVQVVLSNPHPAFLQAQQQVLRVMRMEPAVPQTPFVMLE